MNDRDELLVALAFTLFVVGATVFVSYDKGYKEGVGDTEARGLRVSCNPLNVTQLMGARPLHTTIHYGNVTVRMKPYNDYYFIISAVRNETEVERRYVLPFMESIDEIEVLDTW